MAGIIEEGDNVVFRRDKTWTRVFRVRKQRTHNIGKTRFKSENLIGQSYGTTFEIDNGKLIKVDPEHSFGQTSEIAVSGTDNRNLQDSDSNQKMSKDDIEKLKEDGVAGEKIIEKLIENSETFSTKTEFSQAKFIKKKKEKHVTVFTPLRPTPRLLMDMFRQEPVKICYLRPDSLSQLLSYSNVMYGSNVAVAESCQGLVVGCLLQRMGGKGRLIQLIPDKGSVSKNTFDYFSFSQDYLDQVFNFPMAELAALENRSAPDECNTDGKVMDQPTDITSTTDNGVPVEDGENTNKTDDTSAPDNEGGDTAMEVETNEGSDNVPTRQEQKEKKDLRKKQAADMIAGKQLDSLVIAVKYNPVPVLRKMLKFMSPSKPVVVFSSYIEALKECYFFLKAERLGIQIRLTETWYREYQVLPQRTHPEMNMTGTGGYLLTFMTLDPSAPIA